MTLMALIWPLKALSDDSYDKFDEVTWGVGEPMAVQVICKDEDTIIDIVNADMKGESLVVFTINQKVMVQDCLAFPTPILFYVMGALLHYRDHLDRQSVVIRLGNKNGNQLGWALAPGKFDQDRKQNQQKIKLIPI